MKKVVVYLLVLTLAFSLLGCATTGKVPEEKKPADDKAPVATEKLPLVNTKSIFPVTNEPITMSMQILLGIDSAKPEDIWFWQYFEQQTNVKWNFKTMLNTAWAEKKPIMMASGDYPEVIFISNGFSNAQIAEFGNDGTFIPLNDLIDSYAPNLNKIFKEYPNAKALMTLPDKNIYSLAKIAPSYLGSVGANMNQEWLDKLGLSLPETLEEFHGVLKEFKKAGDLNGDGISNEWPWSGVWKGSSNRAIILNALKFITSGDIDSGIALRDNKATYFPMHDEYYKYLDFMKNIYADGLLDPTVFTMEDTEFQAKGQLRTVGVIAATPRYYTADGYWEKYTYMRPLVENKGDRPVVWSGSEVNSFSYYITDACKNPEAAINWIDIFYDPYYACMSGYGPQSEKTEELAGWENFKECIIGHYIVEEPFDSTKVFDTLGKLKDGDPIRKLAFKNPKTDQNNWPEGLSSVQYREKWMLPWSTAGIFMLGDELFYSKLGYAITVYNKDPSGTVESVWKSTFVKNAQEFKVPGFPSIFFFHDDDTDWIKENMTIISDYAKEMEVKFITGAEKLTLESFKAYQEQIKKLGAEKVNSILYNYYETYKANQ